VSANVGAVPDPAPACPLCGASNACAPAASGRFDLPCWCEAATFSGTLLDAVPEPLRGRACICADCARIDRSGAEPVTAA
jgi:hypothetical protein